MLIHLFTHYSIHLFIYILFQFLWCRFAPIVIYGRLNFISHVNIIKSHKSRIFVNNLFLWQKQKLVVPLKPFWVSIHELFKFDLPLWLFGVLSEIRIVKLSQRWTILYNFHALHLQFFLFLLPFKTLFL